jgi:putative ABC transport system permease protein
VRFLRWRKVARDLAGNRTRTLLVVLSIAVGVFAVGTIAGSNALLQQTIRDEYAASQPSSVTFYTGPFDDGLVDTVRGMRGVADAEARRTVVMRLQTGPDSFRETSLTAITNFTDQRLDLVTPEAGHWPPRRGEIALERSSLRLEPWLVPGTPVTVLTPDGRTHQLTIGARDYEAGAAPAFYYGRIQGHVTFDTIEDLGFGRNYDELRVRLGDTSLDKAAVTDVAATIRARLEKAGTTIYFTWVPTPGKHPANDMLQGLFLVLGFIGGLALLVSAFLVVNTITAILAQQTRQIGVMKAIGARNRQVAGLYFGLVLGYGALSLFVALPLGALGAYLLTGFTAGLANFDAGRILAPPSVIAAEIAVGLLVPVLAAIVPVVRGVRVTVREAISSTGIGDRFGRAWLDRQLQRVRGLPRPTLLSLRNTFRRKTRLALTLAALTLGGAVFMSVFTVRASLGRTLDDALAYFAYDIQVELNQPTRSDFVAREAARVPGVTTAEPWQYEAANRIRPDGSQGRSLWAFGLPPNAKTVRPVMQEGRWLLPTDENAIVMTANVRDDEPDLRVGDQVTLRIAGRDTAWTLVGIAQSPTQRPFVFANEGPFGRAARDVGKALVVAVALAEHDAATQDREAAAITAHLRSVGVDVAATTTTGEIRTTQETLFNVLVTFLSIMAVLLGVVGGLGLMGTMSINVVERAREIGVVRAVGASDGAVLRIFLFEGLLIGLLSWGLGVLVSWPISKVLDDSLGMTFVRRPLAFAFSFEGVATWLVVVAVLATLASLLPAWRASRLAVREVLAYE